MHNAFVKKFLTNSNIIPREVVTLSSHTAEKTLKNYDEFESSTEPTN